MAIPVLKQTTSYRLEKGVPLPTAYAGRKKYPFGEMEIGDSFSFKADELTRVRAAASYFGTRNGKKFSARKDGPGCRCWRTA
jgi:hypothetical protein